MATCAWTASQAQSPFNQGDLGPPLPPTTTIELGEVSLEQITHLLLGLSGQVECLKQEIQEVKEAGVETRTNIKNISQAINVVKDGLRSLREPCTPKDRKPGIVEEMPCPLPKADPIGLVSQPLISWAQPSWAPPTFAYPTPIKAVPLQGPSPPPSLALCFCSPAPAPPLAPEAYAPAPIKVDHPNAYTGKIGSKAHQWMTKMLSWV
ncbi:hypothetical protein RHS03_06512, partial [Rhizoctonia solani]